MNPVPRRDEFPLLAAHPGLHYLDSAATAQLHRGVLEALVGHETGARANVRRGVYALAEAADAAYDGARARAAAFLGVDDPREIVFTSGATASLNLVARAFELSLSEGDEVLVTQTEHHSNFVPWQLACQRSGATLRVLPVDADGRMELDLLERMLTPRVRIVAVTHASNVTGLRTDVARIVSAARSVGAQVLLDGAQATPHGPQDVLALGADYYAFSGHKCYGPNGIGVLWGRRERLEALAPLTTGGGMIAEVTLERTRFAPPPSRFEAGTPPIAQAVGLGAALEWMRTLRWTDIHAHEERLTARLLAGLETIPGARVLGPREATGRLPVVSFVIDGVHPHDLCQLLGERQVCVRGGHHCAQPLLRRFDLAGCTRASIAMYNDDDDIDALLEGIGRAMHALA